jgi:hypothetical protein
MNFDTVAEAVERAPEPHVTPAQGRRLYDHVVATRPEQVLELGTARGVSAAYIAAALDENGHGELTTVDFVQWQNPTPEELLGSAGPGERVDRSYCEPLYDFCFLDGQKNWSVDGLDDLGWTHASQGSGQHYGVDIRSLSERERAEPHLRAVFELIVKGHPSFTELRIEDEWFGWARKAPGEPRRLSITTTRSLPAYALAGMRSLARLIDVRLARRRGRRRGRSWIGVV